MVKKNFKKSIVTMAMAMMLSVTAIAGVGTTAKAANTTDTPYCYNNANGSGTTVWRDKSNSSKVYVYPTSGPAVQYSVLGQKYGEAESTYRIRSNNVIIPQNVQGSITNYVNENGETRAKLRMIRVQSLNIDTSGVWSPDSTRNYTIFD